MPIEYENHFNFAAIWAFGGTLIESHRIHFSQWWKNQWKDIMMLPQNEEVGYVNDDLSLFVQFEKKLDLKLLSTWA
jgi:hypothetical protein